MVSPRFLSILYLTRSLYLHPGVPEGARIFARIADAVTACSAAPACFGVYDARCDGQSNNESDFRLCVRPSTLEISSKTERSCVYVQHTAPSQAPHGNTVAQPKTSSPTSAAPTFKPTKFPTSVPTFKPSVSPSVSPTTDPKYKLGYARSNDCPDRYVNVKSKEDCIASVAYMQRSPAFENQTLSFKSEFKHTGASTPTAPTVNCSGCSYRFRYSRTIFIPSQKMIMLR